jgi:methylaspartate ammonia-lyase
LQALQSEARQPTPETCHVALTWDTPNVLRRPGVGFDDFDPLVFEDGFQVHATLRQLSHRTERHGKEADAHPT